MNKNLKSISFSGRQLFTVAGFLVAIVACRKNEGDLGLNVLPESDRINAQYYDNFTLKMRTVTESPVRTDELSVNMLGSYQDPVFGKKTAAIYTHLRLSALNPNFGTAPVVDSVVLSLVYAGFYGSLETQNFEVYRVNEPFYKDSVYKSNHTLDTLSQNLVVPGFENITPNPTAKIVLANTTDTIKPQLRLRLLNSLGDDIINSGAALSSNENFLNFFMGLCIKVKNPGQTPGTGAILYFNLTDVQSKLSIYYTDNATPNRFDLLINDNCARYTYIENNYYGTQVAQQINDSLSDYPFHYIQSGSGLNTEIQLPDLTQITNGQNIIVNKAELYLPVQYFTTDKYIPPTRIFVFGIDTANNSYVLLDQFTSDLTYGGFYDNTKKAYVFNIGRHVQYLLKGSLPNKGLRITAGQTGVSANRVILSSQSSPNRDKPYLRIYYTKYK
jgi:hypothetical protein